jgi:hypothetical protein
MRYLITTHGCYRKHETVDLGSAKLLVHAFENECIRYGDAYKASFCNKSIHKRKGDYKRKFIATGKYYQMEFSSLPDDPFESYIQCCTTGKRIYDFKNGDLLLSDVLDMIDAYNKHIKDTPIYISVLTCNTECSDKENTNFGEHLTLNQPPRLYPASKKNWNVTRKSVTNARKQNMLIPASRGTLRHRFKPGDRAIHSTKGTETFVTKENRKRLKTTSYFLPHTKVGDAVLYQNQLWRIRSIEGSQYVLEPFKSKTKSFKTLLSKFKSEEPKGHSFVEGVTVNAKETKKMEI